MSFLALDMGSTYTKCYVIEKGRCVNKLEHPTPARLKTGKHRFEIDAEKYAQEVISILKRMITGETTGLLLSTQMHGYVLTDNAFRPISSYVSWQDRACLEISSNGKTWLELLSDQISQEAMQLAGVPIKNSLALCNLYARIQSGLTIPANTRLCTLGGYIIGRLSGKHVCHITNAAPLGMVDLLHGRWNAKLLSAAGMDSLIMPILCKTLEPCAKIIINGVTIDLYPDIGDQQVCAYGADLTPETGLHINIGTAGLIAAKFPLWKSGVFENRAWVEPGFYLRTVSNLPGGRDIDKLRELLAARDGIDASTSWMKCCSVDESTAPIDLWRDETKIESLARIPPDYSFEEIFSYYYAKVAKQYKEAANQIMDEVKSISFSGGAALRNPSLRWAVMREFSQVKPEQVQGKDILVGLQRLYQTIIEMD